ncbi:ABC transporter ATP-binding protein [Jeotgalibacillus proteolyticus]|uniref:Quaternary amine transport ATP-binding protein n=1 Tax=Jeotgalibacillus proteolyticus TaxID=2082395 RepID=A0A2S5GG20_9BACL|nr:betaine/proline/choline family ABC transporter ATP-binding protein [Jeotgalibacillus proteolyticus]PPA71939.1 glycine/betaine ABC transporter ATP-binding protein [Jeotgalibacillus proteolyticus]
MITFHNVKKTFDDGTEAIKGIDLHIDEGKLVALIGPSGCGKTTTMKMINKLIQPTSGKITIEGKDIAHKKDVELRRNIGYVIQRIGLFPHMTIEENVGLIPKLKGRKKEEYKKKVDELLTLVGLEPSVFRKRYPLELSGGQQQRVGVVRALAGEPPIILMDEPFSALDPISREQLQNELKDLQKTIRKTIVFVTHDMDEALKVADEIVVMKDGRIEQIATPKELIENPANEFVRSFIGEERIQSNLNLASPEFKKITSIMEPAKVDSDLNLPSVNAESTLKETALLMLTQNVNQMLVEKDGKIIGMIQKNELLSALAGLGKGA